ncbi:MAG: hypothetical protein GX962_08470 [Epulopiscium sp.]|nr:hypothetical protein [Candidatus Epulonipiscium sp.]
MIPSYCGTSITQTHQIHLPIQPERLKSSFQQGTMGTITINNQIVHDKIIFDSSLNVEIPLSLEKGINHFTITYTEGRQILIEEIEIYYLENPDAIVDKEDPKAFQTVQSAIDSIEKKEQSGTIFIRNGFYYEKNRIQGEDISIFGESSTQTILSYDDFSAKVIGENGERCGTFRSPTFTITNTAIGCQMMNLTIENTYDRYNRPGIESYEERIAQGTYDINDGYGCQAVALRVDADQCSFRNLILQSGQDTLFDNIGRHYFYHCKIAGDVDFIFGEAQSVYEKCDIISRDIYSLPKGYIVAPRTNINFEFGYLLLQCRLLHTIEKPFDTVYLARPWRQDGAVMFKDCYMDQHIKAQGYIDMPSGSFYSFAEKARFYEYGSYGPGALTSEMRKIAPIEVVNRYTKENVLSSNGGQYLDDWKPF